MAQFQPQDVLTQFQPADFLAQLKPEDLLAHIKPEDIEIYEDYLTRLKQSPRAKTANVKPKPKKRK